MKMSYKKAWELVNSMNQQGPDLMVTPKVGGTGGGGSALSDTAKEAIEMFNTINSENKDYLNGKLTQINAL